MDKFSWKILSVEFYLEFFINLHHNEINASFFCVSVKQFY